MPPGQMDGLRPETLALDGGLQIDPVTGAIQPGVTMSVNHLVTPGAGAFSAAELGDIAANLSPMRAG